MERDDELIVYRVERLEDAVDTLRDLVDPIRDFVTSMQTTVKIALFIVAPIVAVTQTVLAALLISLLLKG